MSKLLRRLIALTSAALVVAALTAAPASALQLLGKWGATGSGDGQLNNPFDLAVDPNTGGQYIADEGNNRVVQFDASGGFVRSWGSLGAGDTQFNSPEGVGLDGQGNVWVADYGNNRIKKFDSSGALLAVFGTTGAGPGQLTNPTDVAVDASGNFYTVEQGLGRVQKFTPSGGFVKTWPASNPTGIALAGSNVYAVNYNSDTANRFDTEGNPLGSVGGFGGGAGQFNQPWHLGVDLDGNVYIADRANNRVQKFDAGLGFISTFGWGVSNGAAAFQVCTVTCQAGIPGNGDGQFASTGGVGVDCRGNIYVVDQGFNRVQKFGELGTSAPPCPTKPSNAFGFGKLKRNKHKGTAKLAVNVPGPGTLALTGKGVRAQRPGRAAASRAIAAAGRVKLLIKAKGKSKRKLNRTGKAKVKVKVTYTPTGGDPNTKTKRVKLVKKLG